MADVKHPNGSVITGVPDDAVERYERYGFAVVKKAPAKKAAAKSESK